MQAKTILFPCLNDNGSLKQEFFGLWYNMPGLEDKLMMVNDIETSHSKFVYQLTSGAKIREKIIDLIRKSLLRESKYYPNLDDTALEY